jgi:hypothetical protein
MIGWNGFIPNPMDGLFGRIRALPPHLLVMSGVIVAGCVLGYSFYGVYCWQTTGNFFTPFYAQVEWGRKLGIRPWLLLFPRTLLIDLYGLYTPALVVTALLWLLGGPDRGSQPPQLSLPKPAWWYGFLVHPFVFTSLLVWLHRHAKRFIRIVRLPETTQRSTYLRRFTLLFAIAFSGVHSLINFWANTGHLYSTARHFFGTPFAYIGIGAILTALSVPELVRITWLIALAGLALLIEQWMSYASGGWLG